MNVGDKVYYRPHIHYATMRDWRGHYYWSATLGRKKVRQSQFGKPVVEEYVEELSDKRLEEILENARRSPDSSNEMKKINFIRPKVEWKGVVRAVGENGSVDIDVQSPNSGVTLHCDGVKVQDAGEAWEGHTCRKDDE